jgi:adenylate cyclase
VDLLNECFSLLVDVILKNGGFLDKYIGDAMMAVFGVPYTHKDDAIRAVRSALKMREMLNRLNERRTAADLEPLRLGIGISTGEVISGNIGSRKRMDFTVIGDDVNISQYLEKLNKDYGTGILISEATCRELNERFVVRLVDEVLFKGRKRPVRVFEVLGEKGYQLSLDQDKFNNALTLYRERKFEAASLLFLQGAATDPPCKVFLSRCHTFLKNPPPHDWKGIWVE